MNRILRAPVLALLAAGSLFSNSLPSAAATKTRDRIEILEETHAELEKQVSVLREDQVRLKEEVSRLRAALEEGGGLGTRVADLGARVDSAGSDVRALFESVNEVQARLRRMEDQLQATLLRIEQSAARPPESAIAGEPGPVVGAAPGQIPGAGVQPATGRPAAAGGSAEPARPGGTAAATETPLPPGVAAPAAPRASRPAAPAPDPDTIFQAAYADYARGNYALAIDGFEDYLAQYARLQQADDALYWIGESHAALGDAEAAIRDYDRLLASYPKGDRVPDARLKRGFALFDANRILEGTRELRGLIEDHPDTPAARAACQRLREMRLACE